MTSAPFELAIERHIAATPEIVWQVMTERLAEWWCPKPWRAEVVEQDWRAGGRNAVTMYGPNGEESGGEGIFLEVVPNRRIVFTDAFKAGWIPQEPFMVGFFELSPDGDGTHYRAGARHWSEAAFNQHKDMGFEGGWSAVAAQLAELAEAAASARS
jgi:uncharacterized protein YndB with AHSA1/START domain